MTMQLIDSLSSVSEKYEVFIIDLWGVLHDGTAPYPGAIDALTNLRKQNKKIILLSNAPRQSHKAEEVLNELGFGKELYDKIITSGQVTHDCLQNTNEHGSKYFYIGPAKDEDIIADLENYQIVDNAKDADFTLVTGFDGVNQGFETKQDQVDASLAEDLLVICANPDRKVVKQNGDTWLCAGLIYDYYLEKGGKAIIYGKPYKEVYDRCFEYAGIEDKSKYLAIGDSLHTDVAGGNNSGIDSVLCAGGILAVELGLDDGDKVNIDALESLCDKENAVPTYVIPSFIW